VGIIYLGSWACPGSSLTVGLCRETNWKNITITIVDIIHRPVFYFKLGSTLQVCPYLTGNTLRLRYEPNRLMLSIGLRRWYISITITILDIIHRPIVLYIKHDDSDTGFCQRLQVEPTQFGPLD
jgi:hypothetical protein